MSDFSPIFCLFFRIFNFISHNIIFVLNILLLKIFNFFSQNKILSKHIYSSFFFSIYSNLILKCPTCFPLTILTSKIKTQKKKPQKQCSLLTNHQVLAAFILKAPKERPSSSCRQLDVQRGSSLRGHRERQREEEEEDSPRGYGSYFSRCHRTPTAASDRTDGQRRRRRDRGARDSPGTWRREQRQRRRYRGDKSTVPLTEQHH